MKQLTQDVFKGAPDWVKSAAIDSNGRAWGYDAPKSILGKSNCDWFPTIRDADSDVWLFKGVFDATDWQNSAIDREV